MALINLVWRSEIIPQHVSATILLPTVGTPPYPTFYLLHGYSDDHTIWLRRTRIEVAVERLPMIVVMPAGYNSFYTDHEQGPAFGRYIGEELPGFIEKHFSARTDRGGRCIGGLSMGGYGALRVGLRYADRFCSVHSHSGAVLAGSRPVDGTKLTQPRMFGTNPAGTEHDVLELARRAEAQGNLPAIHIDCGVDDFLIEDNRTCHARLEQMGIPHTYIEHPGEHNWDYWNEHIADAIAFHVRHLGIGPHT